MEVKYDIVIPHFGVDDRITSLCKYCLKSIAACSSDYRVILVDNGTPAEQFERILPALAEVPHLLVRNTVNEGFIKATNQGIWLSTAPRVVLMNNDTQAVPGWLEQLAAPLADGAYQFRVGLSGPRTTTPKSWQGRIPAGVGAQILAPNHMLAFFCTIFRRDVFEEIGVLDESYGIGFGDDDEFCRRAERAGWRMALVQDLVIPHMHRSTFLTVHSPEQVHQMQVAALARFHATG